MINIGYFDRNFLKATVSKGIILLKNCNLTETMRRYVREDIEMYKRFLDGDFNLPKESYKRYDRFGELKNHILLEMERHYKLLGKDLIEWLINLNEEKIFCNIEENIFSDTSAYEQAEQTLQIYKKYNKTYYKQANEIFSCNSTSRVQEDYSLSSSSYCAFCSITGLPLIVVNPSTSPTVVNHEIQHAVEWLLGYNKHELYGELGPITFELLLNDSLEQKTGVLNLTDYYMRVNDTANALPQLSKYFELMLIFSKSDFKVSTEVFIELMCEKYSKSIDSIHSYLEEHVASNIINDDMIYLFSYLKAIELRGQIMLNKENGIARLEEFLRNPIFNFEPSKKNIKIYSKYIDEFKI